LPPTQSAAFFEKRKNLMKRSDSFDSFAKSTLPALVLSFDFHVAARNESALALSNKCRIGSAFSPCLKEDERVLLLEGHPKGEVLIASVLLPEREALSALFIPCYKREEPCFLTVLFEEVHLKGLPPLLSQALRGQERVPASVDSEAAAEFFEKSFRRAFASALSPQDFPEIFLIRHACAFLNRFSDRTLKDLGFEIEALCTVDCQSLPLYNFPRFTALLLGLCLFCLLGSTDCRVRALFYTENEKATVKMSFKRPADGNKDGNKSDALPLLFETPLALLGYEVRLENTKDGRTDLLLLCQKAMPAGAIRTPADEELAERLLEILLFPFTERSL
jgi:hypothetical protein